MFSIKTPYLKSSHKEPGDRLYADFITSIGDFEAVLYAKECPETVWNFINLAEGRQQNPFKYGPFFENLIFHRDHEEFIIRGGCPEGTGNGGPGYHFEDEINPLLGHGSEGILSMFNSGPDTNGSQFLITLAPMPHFDGKNTVFGKIVKGMEVVRNIGEVSSGSFDHPKQNVVIKKVIIKREF